MIQVSSMRVSRALAAVAVALVVASGAGARTVRVGVAVDVEVVAIGLTGHDVAIQVGSGSADTERGPIRFGLRDPPVASAEGGSGRSAARRVVRVRVESSRRKADLVEAALRDALKVPLHIERSGAGFAVIAGPFDSTRRAEAIRDQLHAVGMSEAVVADVEQDDGKEKPGARLMAVTGGFKVIEVAGETATLASPDQATLEVDGRPYRGKLVVSVNRKGLLTVVDEVDLEDYVRGVVPEEMGPELYPALAALEAQSVAARTYALRTGAHADQGFDLCTTAHCQVYGGAASEHPLSDRAVAGTAGQVATWEGKPAATYFSSTCGGHTEDVSAIFPGESQPYLRGVSCYPDQVDFTRVASGSLAPDWSLVNGAASDDVLAKLVAAGVVSADEARQGGFSRRVRDDELRAWIRRAASALGLGVAEGAEREVSTVSAIDFMRSFVAFLGWSDERALLAPQDLSAAARFRSLQGLSGDELAAALLAMKAGILPQGLEAGWASAKLSRGNVLEMLELWLETSGGFDVESGRFVSAQDGALRVLQGHDASTIPLASSAVLLSARRDAPPRLRESLDFKVGDRLRMLRDRHGAATYVVLEEDPDGAAFDRLSSYAWWTRRLAAADLAKAAALEGVEGLQDLRVTKTTPAGRIVGLELVGNHGARKELLGLRVRSFLGVPELRAKLSVQRTPEGRFAGAVVTGRGWGHGVGLCQTGAYGMALAGRSSEEILRHYYPGTKLSALSDLGPAE